MKPRSPRSFSFIVFAFTTLIGSTTLLLGDEPVDPGPVIENRLLTGSTTIDAGRHIAGLQSIGTITLNGGTLSGTEGTNIIIHSGGNAQLANGLRLTSASDFTFNGANQTHELQISYNRPTGTYNIVGAVLPGTNTYTDASGNQRQEFGGAWKTSAEYGNILGAKQTFTEETRPNWNTFPGGSNRAWQRPGTSGTSSDHYIYNQEVATTAQPTFRDTRSTTTSGLNTSWELARGAGPLVNERINPLISGQVTPGSSLDLSGISFDITGTAVSDRVISGGTINLGRRMVGANNVLINRDNDIVTLSTSGSDDHRTRLSLGGFALDNSTGVTATHTGSSGFNAANSTAVVQVTGNFIIDTSVAGYNTHRINAGSFIAAGETLAGANTQSTLNIGYAWNNVQNNTLVVRDLLVIDSNTRSGSRNYETYVSRGFGTDTHTAISWTGNSVQVNGTITAGLTNLGNTTVTAIGEGLAGELVTGPQSFNTRYASVTDGTYTATHNGSPSGPLTDGNTITIRDTGSGIYQNNIALGNISISGGQNLDYQLNYGGGAVLLEHGQSRNFTIDYIGDSSIPIAGQLGRVSRADLNIELQDRVNYTGIVAAQGDGRSVNQSHWGDSLGTTSFALETRIDAPAAAVASSAVASGTDFGVNGLSLTNTASNSSSRISQSTSFELIDSQTLSSGTTVKVEFIKLDEADPAVIAALESADTNAASLAGMYGGGSDIFASEIIELTGLNGVLQVLQISYDTMGYNYEDGAQLLWKYDYTDGDGSKVAWINAVLGNSNITLLDLAGGTLSVDGGSGIIADYLTAMRYAGSYADYLAEYRFTDLDLTDPQLGMWGVDVDSNNVWAVIDHNSSFGAAIPEPGIFSLLLLSAGGFLIRRRSA